MIKQAEFVCDSVPEYEELLAHMYYVTFGEDLENKKLVEAIVRWMPPSAMLMMGASSGDPKKDARAWGPGIEKAHAKSEMVHALLAHCVCLPGTLYTPH